MRVIQGNSRARGRGARKGSVAGPENNNPVPTAPPAADWSASFVRWRAEWDKKTRARAEAWDRVWGQVVQAAKKNHGAAEPESPLTALEVVQVLQKRKKIGNMHLNKVQSGLRHRHKYSLVGISTGAVIVGECKNCLGVAEVTEFANIRLPYFTTDFPHYVAGKVYGMVCARYFTPGALAEAKKRKLFVMQFKNDRPRVTNLRTARPLPAQ